MDYAARSIDASNVLTLDLVQASLRSKLGDKLLLSLLPLRQEPFNVEGTSRAIDTACDHRWVLSACSHLLR